MSIPIQDRTFEEAEMEALKRHLDIENGLPKPDFYLIRLLENRIKELNELFESDRRSYDRLIKQSQCSHKLDSGCSAFKYDGHDSHKRFYKCIICGHEYDE